MDDDPTGISMSRKAFLEASASRHHGQCKGRPETPRISTKNSKMEGFLGGPVLSAIMSTGVNLSDSLCITFLHGSVVHTGTS